jgi:hypothetical protein
MPIESYPEALEIHENPDSLVITYRGSQNVGRAVIFLLSSILGLVFLLLVIAPDLDQFQLSEVNLSPIILICPGVFLLLFIYSAYITLTWALDLMLDREKVTITAGSLTIEKSGFSSIHLSREFYLNESACLHPMFMAIYMESMISVSPSRLTTRLSQTGGFRHWFLASPMRWFCRGLSKEEHVTILQRIKRKFPNINVLMDYEPLVGPG